MAIKKQKARRIEAKKDEIFFMNISDPSTTRRNLLEASQQVIVGLKSYEKYKKIKAEKFKKIDFLKTITTQMTENAGKLRACLPTVKGLPEKVHEEKLPHATEIELEQLNEEINKLEKELLSVK